MKLYTLEGISRYEIVASEVYLFKNKEDAIKKRDQLKKFWLERESKEAHDEEYDLALQGDDIFISWGKSHLILKIKEHEMEFQITLA